MTTQELIESIEESGINLSKEMTENIVREDCIDIIIE